MVFPIMAARGGGGFSDRKSVSHSKNNTTVSHFPGSGLGPPPSHGRGRQDDTRGGMKLGREGGGVLRHLGSLASEEVRDDVAVGLRGQTEGLDRQRVQLRGRRPDGGDTGSRT